MHARKPVNTHDPDKLRHCADMMRRYADYFLSKGGLKEPPGIKPPNLLQVCLQKLRPHSSLPSVQSDLTSLMMIAAARRRAIDDLFEVATRVTIYDDSRRRGVRIDHEEVIIVSDYLMSLARSDLDPKRDDLVAESIVNIQPRELDAILAIDDGIRLHAHGAIGIVLAAMEYVPGFTIGSVVDVLCKVPVILNKTPVKLTFFDPPDLSYTASTFARDGLSTFANDLKQYYK